MEKIIVLLLDKEILVICLHKGTCYMTKNAQCKYNAKTNAKFVPWIKHLFLMFDFEYNSRLYFSESCVYIKLHF